MATSWKSQQGNEEYSLQFETDNKEKYKLVEKAAQMAMDGKAVADFVEVKHGRYEDDYCTVCGCAIPTDDRDDAIFESEVHYCYYCGAKMDGRE